MGKSTTLRQLVTEIPSETMTVRQASSNGTGRQQPYKLVSDLVGLSPQYPPRPDFDDNVLGNVERLCENGPVVLVGDDLHNADGDSLRLVQLLVAATKDLPLVLVLACRPLPERSALLALKENPDVLQVDIDGLNVSGVRAIVEAETGAPPGRLLTTLLDMAAGNPFHVSALLHELQQEGRLTRSEAQTELRGDDTSESAELRSLEGTVRTRLALLGPPVRDLLVVLAVWSRPVAGDELAAVAGLSPAEVIGLTSEALESHVVSWTPDHELRFSHDLYRDVLYEETAPGIRRLLHGAIADHLRQSGEITTLVAEHARLADRAIDPTEAIHTAQADLGFAPEQAVDLLLGVTAPSGSVESNALAIAKAGALASAGHMHEVQQITREALSSTSDPTTRNALTRLLLHAVISDANTDEALTVVDLALPLTSEPQARDALVHLRRWAVLLQGTEPVAMTTTPAAHLTGAALVPDAMDLFLQGRCRSALDTVLKAEQARRAASSPAWSDGATAPVWPGLFALYSLGPEEAMRLSSDARQKAQDEERMWLFPLHLRVAAVICQTTGQLDDALADAASSLEMAELTGLGWMAQATGVLVQTYVLRGQLDDANSRLEQREASGLFDEYGLPFTPWSRALLGEAQGDVRQAAKILANVWEVARSGRRFLFFLMTAVEALRIARQAGDEGLAKRIVADTSAIPTDEVPVLAPTVPLIEAMASQDAPAAAAAAAQFSAAGNVLGALNGFEEAAVAAAAARRQGRIPSQRRRRHRPIPCVWRRDLGTAARRSPTPARNSFRRLGTSRAAQNWMGKPH
jgi:hypothetical protein